MICYHGCNNFLQPSNESSLFNFPKFYFLPGIGFSTFNECATLRAKLNYRSAKFFVFQFFSHQSTRRQEGCLSLSSSPMLEVCFLYITHLYCQRFVLSFFFTQLIFIFGGLCGLCLGFSLLSGLEILYWIIIRIVRNVILHI